MIEILKDILKDESAQDIVEYALLLAFVVVASAALFLNSATSMSGIWSVMFTNVSAANSVAAS